MGLPEILIEFKAKAETAVRRSENGIVAIILRDDTKTGEGNLSYKYQTAADYGVASAWNATNRKYLNLAFAGAPKNVLVERIGADETYDDALARLKNKKWNWLAIAAGAKGNVAVGKINRFPVTLPKLTEVTNITAFTGGYDEESDSELLERYLEKVSRPNVSGNKYHYIEWAKEVSGVGEASVIPLWNGPGTVKVVIVDSLNQPATSDLITAVSEHIEELRPIGASVTVVSATALTINISVKLTTDGSEDIKDKISAALTEYLTGDALKKSYISYAKIGGCILAVDGVEDYATLRVNSGTANISIPAGSVPVLGSVVIT